MKRTPRDLQEGDHVPGQLTIDGERPRVLSLFSGYGGLDLAVAAVLDGDVIAHAEVEPGACRVLAHRFPGVPNLGDVTAIDWRDVGPVDVITGGFPCQDVSLAGRRLGIRHDTRSGLWGHMAAAVDELRPALVVIENVRGLLSARAHHPAHSDMEPCPWCLARPDDVHLRALGAVLGDLSDLGYDAGWRTIRAADVGAPHGRERVFVVAWPAGARDAAGVDGEGSGAVGDDRRPVPARVAGRRAAENAECEPRDERRLAAPGQTERGQARSDAGGRGRAPAADADGCRHGGEQNGRRMGPRERQRTRTVPRDRGGAADADPDGGGRSAAVPYLHGCYLHGWESDPCGSSGAAADADPESVRRDDADRWGPYGPAVRRWEAVLARPAPAPTEPSSRGAERLSPRFVEWMMGLPDGWVVDVPGVTRNDALRLLGNGVVPQQAVAAVASLLHLAQQTAPPPVVGEGAA